MKRNLPQKTIQFTEPQLKWLEDKSAEIGITVAELLRRIVDDYRGVSIAQCKSTEHTRSK